MFFFKKKSERIPQNTQDRAMELLSKAINAATENAQKQVPTLMEEQHVWESNYGLDASNPIISDSLQGTSAYLGRLCTSDGKTFTWSGYTSIRAEVHGLPDVGVDKYTLYLDEQPYTEVFFVPYVGTAEFPPAGLFFVDDDTDWDEERLLAQRAYEMGTSREIVRKLTAIEAEEKEQEDKDAVRKKEAEGEISLLYPEVNIDVELKNPLFETLFNQGFNAVTVYEYVHSDQLLIRKKLLRQEGKTRDPSRDDYYKMLMDLYEEEFKQAWLPSRQDEEAFARSIGAPMEVAKYLWEEEKKAKRKEWEKRRSRNDVLSWQAVELKRKYPSFNFEEEIKNEEFVQLIEKVSLKEAFEILHFSDLFERKLKTSNSTPDATPIVAEVKWPSMAEEKGQPDKRLFCRNCGRQIPPDSKFCQNCGTKVVREPQLSKEKNVSPTESFSSVFRRHFSNINDLLDDSAIALYIVRETACFLTAAGDAALFFTGRSEEDRLRFAKDVDTLLMSSAQKEYSSIKQLRDQRLDLYGKVMRGGYIRNEWSFWQFNASVFDDFPIGKAAIAFGDILINPDCANNYENAAVMVNDMVDQQEFIKMFSEKVIPDIIKFCDELSLVP